MALLAWIRVTSNQAFAGYYHEKNIGEGTCGEVSSESTTLLLYFRQAQKCQLTLVLLTYILRNTWPTAKSSSMSATEW